MKTHKRPLEFDALERLALLSTIHPIATDTPHATPSVITPLPRYVRSVMQAARAQGSHVTEQTIVVPGSFTTYEITFRLGRKTYTTDITIPARPTIGPIEPG